MAVGSYRKGLGLSLGVISTSVDLTSVVPSSDGRPRGVRICPEHHVKVTQVHRCYEGPHDVEPVVAYSDGKYWRLDDGERPEIESVDGMELTPVPTDQLMEHVFDGPSAYWMAPSNTQALQGWHVIKSVVSKGKVTFICKGALRRGSVEKLWRLTTFRGGLVMREIVFPDRLREPPDVPDMKVKREITQLVNKMIESITDDWKNIDTTDRGAEALKGWVATLEKVPRLEGRSKSAPEFTPQDLLQALREAVGENT